MGITQKCGLIARVSTLDQARIKEGSIATQLDLMRNHIDYKNNIKGADSSRWEETKTYILEGISGSKSIESEKFDELRQDIATGVINTVICSRLDRVSRSIKHFVDFFDFLKEHGVEFVSVLQELDTTSVYGRFITYVLMALAELEREQTSERMKVSKKIRAEKGRWTGGITPLGYDLGDERGELAVNEDEATLVRHIFNTYLNLGSIRKVATLLNEEGYRTKKRISKSGNVSGNNKLNSENIRRVLRGKEYIGIQQINKKNQSKEQEEIEETQRYSEAQALWKPIIDEDMFWEVQDLLDKGKRTGHNAVVLGKHSYLLSGLLYCGKCLSKMKSESTKKSDTKRYFRYVCRNEDCSVSSIPAKEIEESVIENVSELAFKRDVLTRIIDETNKRMSSDLPRWRGEVKVLNKSVEKTSGQIENLMHKLGELESNADREVKLRLEKLSAEKNEKLKSIAKLENQIKGCSSNKIITEAVLVALDRFNSTISVLNSSDQKKLIGLVVNKVYYDGDRGLRIAIYGNSALFSPDSLTRNEKCAERHDWRLEEDLNLRPSG